MTKCLEVVPLCNHVQNNILPSKIKKLTFDWLLESSSQALFGQNRDYSHRCCE
jgi:hypothetical protein